MYMMKLNNMIQINKRILCVLLGACFCSLIMAQPAKRRVPARDAQTAAKPTDRASLQFPTSVQMPDDVVWKRDIYRQLDLTLDKNAPLYYPVEPSAGLVNLFTYLFDLLLTGKITAYEYRLDGNESFTSRYKVNMKDLMGRYHIYYEENNGRLQVNASDIPSAEVTRYYIKETSYFDQRTSTYRTKVTALCPVLVRGDDFGGESTPYPLFWLNYDEISPYLTKHTMMSSNYNNTTNMTAEDYFSMNRYEGKIYKTNNMQGKVLANYCKTDSALVKEQKRIEKELSDFENHIWGHVTDSASIKKADSLQLADKPSGNKKEKRSSRNSRRSSSEKEESKPSKEVKSGDTKKGFFSSSSSSTPRVTVRRQRR